MGTLIALGKDLIYTSGGGPSPTPTPDGKIVIPINDVTIWQECAGITEGYSTMADILADSAMLLLLMGDDNAVDYMVRSTDFISDITSNQNAMNDIGLNNYASNILLTDSVWCAAICSSTYFESVLNVKVPTMTSNTTPSGECFSSSEFSAAYPTWKAFDGDTTTQGWGSGNGTGVGQYCGYKFTSQKDVYVYKAQDANNRMTSIKFQGSNNGSSWADISPVLSTKIDRWFSYRTANPTKYQYYRMYVNAVSQNNVAVTEIQFYGREDVEVVPDGKTVTPTDDVSIWLQCGQRSENYTTLAEVLADSTCLSALMADNNAVDYLKRSKSFAKSEALVPTMTSDNTPSGICIASTVLSGYNAYKAFDGDNTSAWIPNNNATNNYVGYEFTSVQRVEKVTATIMRGNWGGSVPSRTFKVQGYSDDWHDIGTITTEATNTTSTDNYMATITTSGLYTKCRLFCEDITHSDGQYDVRIMELQFYNVAVGVTENATAMSYIGLNNYCANTLLGDSDWCEAICNSTYFESVLNVKVPTMTSNTTPSGEVSASNYETQYGGRPPYHAFDNNVSATNWATIVNTTSGWIQYMFTSSVCIKAVNIFTDYRVKNFKIQASNDNFVSDTHDIYTGICNNNTSPTNNRFSMYTSDTDYQYWRVQVENIYSGAFNNVSINEIQFYGREDV